MPLVPALRSHSVIGNQRIHLWNGSDQGTGFDTGMGVGAMRSKRFNGPVVG